MSRSGARGREVAGERHEASVHVYGMAGYNLGDDAIALVVNRELRMRLPRASIRSATLVPGALTARYGLDEVLVDRRSPGGIVRLVTSVARADAFVLGGGTLVQDALGLGLLRGNLAYARQLCWLARRLGKPVTSVGLGVDALTSSRGRTYARAVLRSARFHYLRDARSHELARTYADGLLPDTVVGGDPAVLLERHAGDDRRPLASDRYLAVSLVHEGLDLSAWFPRIRRAAQDMKARLGVREVLLIAMDRREGEESMHFRALGRQLQDDGMIVHTRIPEDAIEARTLLRHAYALVAMRLHAMILAAGVTPMVAISRTTKTDTFASEVGVPCFDVRDPMAGLSLGEALRNQVADADALDAQRRRVIRMQAMADAAFDGLADAIARSVPAARGDSMR